MRCDVFFFNEKPKSVTKKRQSRDKKSSICFFRKNGKALGRLPRLPRKKVGSQSTTIEEEEEDKDDKKTRAHRVHDLRLGL